MMLAAFIFKGYKSSERYKVMQKVASSDPFQTLISSLRLVLIYIMLFVLSLYVAWFALAKVDYAYPLWYSMLNIDQHIEEFAPQNDYGKADFALISQEERLKVFADIVTAVHSSGEGLNTIRYQLPNNLSKLMLTYEEVVHLQDVANLIDAIHYLALVMVVLLVALLVWRPQALAQSKWVAIASIGLVALITLVIAIIGATEVFYWLHTVVFPDNHKWFFYYQESLMSTSMKAPDLFLAIGAGILIVALPIFIAARWWLMKKFPTVLK